MRARRAVLAADGGHCWEKVGKDTSCIGVLVTREYTKAPNRMTHLINQGGIIRNLTPLEVERLNMFPENHTMDEKLSDSKRIFLMGNALVVVIIEKIGRALQDKVDCFGL